MSTRASRSLDLIERIGNRLPDPTTLFVLGALLVMALSQLAVALDWSVEKTVSREVRAPVLDAEGAPVVDPGTGVALSIAVLDPGTGRPQREIVRDTVRPTSLLEPDGLYWVLESMVRSFVNFPPLGIVLVGMLGIGLAERSGFIGALLKAMLIAVPPALLTPTVFLVGVLSSVALDAGYVVLPPVAAALYAAVGRSPLVGLAAVFAGVSAGFSANLVITSLDPILAGFSEAGAHILDPTYRVAATANWGFMVVSTVLLTGIGWAVTARWVEPRFAGKPPEEGGPAPPAGSAADALGDDERRSLTRAVWSALIVVALLVALTWIPGAPLHGIGARFPRWVTVIVPLIFIAFAVPGVVFGISQGVIRSDRDVAKLMAETMAGMGSYIVLAFFAAQFIAYFQHSGLGEMLAITGGTFLAGAALPGPLLLVGFIAVVVVANLFIGSMSAKYAFFAPVFVPMFMQTGISPELTQAAYRVGDSVSNVITPLNPYVVIILVFMRRYVPQAGVGTLVSLMLPYTVVLGVLWTALLVVWVWTGIPLGPAGPLTYDGLP